MKWLVCVHHTGCRTFSCSGNRVDSALVSRHKELQRQVCDLTEEEEQLDALIAKCNFQLKLLTEDTQNKKYPFRMIRPEWLALSPHSKKGPEFDSCS